MLIFRERGAFSSLESIACDGGVRSLVVASVGARARLKLAERTPRASFFSDFHANPTFEQAVQAARLRERVDARVVVGVGGGSAMDVAKAARSFSGNTRVSHDILERRRAPNRSAGLVLVPTTAGSGSEVTQFATLYRDGLKASLDNAEVRADTAIIDPELTETCDRELTWVCAFDALAHSVESFWSTRSDHESRRLAEAALRRLVPILRSAGEVPSAEERDLLAEAAMLAGMAINITRTTAAHALAYPLTVRLGVPHGLACAINLTWLAPLIEAAAPERVLDERGARMLSTVVGELRRLLGAGDESLGACIRRFLDARGLRTRLRTNGEADCIEQVVSEGIRSSRIGGTPIRLDADVILRRMRKVFDATDRGD